MILHPSNIRAQQPVQNDAIIVSIENMYLAKVVAPNTSETQENAFDNVLVYEIVTQRGQHVWRVYKKAASFVYLHSLLSGYMAIPDLPPSFHELALLQHSGPVSNEHMGVHALLQTWLQQLCAVPALAMSPILQQFIMQSDLQNPLPTQEQPTVPAKEEEDTVRRSLPRAMSEVKSPGAVADPDEHTIDLNPQKCGVGLDDFVLIKVIGKGSFGKVMLVRRVDTQKIFAMKVIRKESVIKRNQLEHTKTERSVLGYIDHPFIVALRYAFQTRRKLYLVMDFCPGGELFYHLGREGRFSEHRTRLYAAEIVLALEYLHKNNIVYRDLKPENVLLDSAGHIAITDFGLSKEGINDNVSATSFCGTPEYLAPEILTRTGHGRAADWWSLGSLLFEMLTGMPPFYSRNRDRLFQKILYARLRVPHYFSATARSLLAGLLCRDPVKRLGSKSEDAGEIKRHPFFASIDWEAVLQKKIQPTFVPMVRNMNDTANFDAEFTSMPVDSLESKSVHPHSLVGQYQFQGFTYVRDSLVPSLRASQARHEAARAAGAVAVQHEVVQMDVKQP